MRDRLVRSVVWTRDQDTAVEVISGLVEHSARIRIADPDEVQFEVRATSVADWGGDQVDVSGARYAADVPPLPFLVAGVFTDGHGVLRSGGQDIAVGAGDSFLYPLAAPFHCDYQNACIQYLRVPPTYAAGLAEEVSGLPAVDLRFLSVMPVSTTMREFWAATVHYVVGQLNTADLDLPPLVADQMLRLATGSLLRAFPNTTMTAVRAPTAGRVTPAVVRRAVAYMDANADRPVALAEVAAASGVGVRALQLAFRRHLDLTPLAYLRRVRLHRAHRDLVAAQPGDGSTVATIARRWGFAKASRFTAVYQSTFGELPSHTLRT